MNENNHLKNIFEWGVSTFHELFLILKRGHRMGRMLNRFEDENFQRITHQSNENEVFKQMPIYGG